MTAPNTYWSTHVQTTEELYLSRALRFRPDNMHRWIEAMDLRDGTDLLEVGCAGGLLCHRIKAALPAARITGMDLDENHIAYARKKSAELGLSCRFVTGDAACLPFEENSFDACYSHTVINFCPLTPFLAEQKRVLRPGGRLLILCVVNMTPGAEEWVPTEGCEEKPLFDRLWAAAQNHSASEVVRYENRPQKYMEELAQQGFVRLSVEAVSAVKYAPDYENTPPELARAQINEDRLSELCSAQKARGMAPDALTDSEYAQLQEMINRRYDRQLNAWARGEKKWEYRLSTVLILSGQKPE